ncbi:MAG: ribonuclease N [Chloroflexi bacterium]|nr:ribonuclease N [Chloroflexota bacterium]
MPRIPSPTAPAPTPDDGLATVRVADLPDQSLDTLGLISNGGPFPYRQDGAVFQNREGLLPAQPSGYYHEYTVDTPGSRDRGARRIVTGSQGELYYTDDHYDSFRRVIE